MLLLRWLPLALIALAGFWLRTSELGQRPMHADEANQAVKLGELLDHGHYAFDPRDHHGPTLYYAAAPIAWLRGERSLAALTETTVRLVPALFGTISIILLALLAAPAPRWSEASRRYWPAWAAAALLAVSPPSVYYSRYFIQETLLVTFTLATLVCARAWWHDGRIRWAIAAGVCAGLAQATKASAPIFLAAAAIAAVAVGRASARPDPATSAAKPGGLKPALLWAIAAAFTTAALLYSSFGTNFAGLRDALSTYSQAVTRFGQGAAPTGHEKPWYYYLSLFGWQRHGGVVWEQLGFSLLVLAGLALAFTKSGARFRWAAIYTAIVVTTLSVFSYKTPWHAVHFVPGMALLAAGGLTVIAQLRTGKFVTAAIALAVLGSLAKQTRLAAFRFPAVERNPYAYVHSSMDVLKIRALAQAAIARQPNEPIRVIAEEYWPLPWYLRGLPRVGFWSTPPDDCDGALVITSATQSDAVRSRLRGAYRESYVGLRPGIILVVFTANVD